MEKELLVLKVYPKINGQYVGNFNDLGFQLSTSKNKGLYYKAGKDISIQEMSEKMEEFLNFAKRFNLNISFDVAKTVTYSEKIENLSLDDLGDSLLNEM